MRRASVLLAGLAGLCASRLASTQPASPGGAAAPPGTAAPGAAPPGAAASADDRPWPAALLVLAQGADPALNRTVARLHRLRLDGSHDERLGLVNHRTTTFAAHQATGRWAITMESFVYDPVFSKDVAVTTTAGAPVTTVPHRANLWLGDLSGPVATTVGDPWCDNARRTCFERPAWCSPDGAYVFVTSGTVGTELMSRWTFDASPRRATITDRRTGWLLSADRASGRAVYQGRGGEIYVTRWPAQRRKAGRLARARRPVATLPRLNAPVAVRGDHLHYLRLDPDDDSRGAFEIYDLAAHRRPRHAPRAGAGRRGPHLRQRHRPAARGVRRRPVRAVAPPRRSRRVRRRPQPQRAGAARSRRRRAAHRAAARPHPRDRRRRVRAVSARRLPAPGRAGDVGAEARRGASSGGDARLP